MILLLITAAKLLGVSVSTLKRRMNETGLRWPRVNKSKSSTSHSSSNSGDRQDDSYSGDSSRANSPLSPPSMPSNTTSSSNSLQYFGPNSGKYREGIQQQESYRFSPYQQHATNLESAGYNIPPQHTYEQHYSGQQTTNHPNTPAGNVSVQNLTHNTPYQSSSSEYPMPNIVQMSQSDYSLLMEELNYLRNENYNLKMHLQQRDTHDYYQRQMDRQHAPPQQLSRAHTYPVGASGLPSTAAGSYSHEYNSAPSLQQNGSDDGSTPGSSNGHRVKPALPSHAQSRRGSLAPPLSQESIPSLPTRYPITGGTSS
eukprot:CAMPEP_0117441062 /NCGR_PEP_ID=MMETSP0759-20121206/3428_1 /TAXON_ID=63605 /ORGANISM="Percolomonas cosmopolitus, Strain WS" /LENGTH=311 /DNA_ID=CAMNT_0005232879 /DNA_START=369 /DNA_END=1304 /DNA_ORIENTATION=+